MRDYELTILLQPSLSEKDAEKTVKDISAILEKLGAKIKKKTDPEKRQLAYEIAKNKEALYVYIEFQLDPEKEKVMEMESKIKLVGNIIRYLLVKKGA